MSDSEGGGGAGCIWLIIFIIFAFSFGPEVFDVAWNFLEAEVGLGSYMLLWFLSFVATWAAIVAVAKAVTFIVAAVLFAFGVGGVGVWAAFEYFRNR